MFVVTQCPVCGGQSFEPYLKCTDHTVSHETFQLVKCETCTFIFTSPRPEDKELGKYYLSDDYISHTAGSDSILDKVYKISRVFTLQWKLRIVRKNLSSDNGPLHLLDYGCGTGNFLKAAKNDEFIIEGVEPSSIARALAIEATGEKIHESLHETSKQYQVITLWHVMEHVPDLNKKMEELKDRLAKNGTMFIAVPNHLSTDARIYKEDWAAYDVPRHLWHFNKENMKRILKKHDLRLEKIIPMKLDAFYVSLLSEKNKAGKNSFISLLKGLLNGVRSNYGRNNNEYSSLIYVIKK